MNSPNHPPPQGGRPGAGQPQPGQQGYPYPQQQRPHPGGGQYPPPSAGAGFPAPAGNYQHSGGYPGYLQQPAAGYAGSAAGAQQPPHMAQPGPPYPGGAQQPKRSRKSRGLLLGIGAGIVLLILGGALAALLIPSGPVLDSAAVEQGVQRVLTEDYDAGNVSNVDCPRGQPVEPGTSFECTATIEGAEQAVPISVTTTEGEYVVGLLR